MKFRLLSVLMLLMSAAAPANGTITQTVGGPGGSPYEMRCPDGSAVAGVHATAGTWIDSIALICTVPGSGQRTQIGFTGGTGGSPQEGYCRSGALARGMYMTFTRGNDLPRQYLDSLALQCSDEGTVCIQTGEDCGITAGHPAHIWGALGATVGADPADFLSCPSDEVLVGLAGKSGNYIDSVAAICGPSPKPPRFVPASPGVMIGPGDKMKSRVSTTGNRHDFPVEGPSSSRVIERTPPTLPDFDRCKEGFVWREASPQDHVCVTVDSRTRVAVENKMAAMRVDPNGAYGPNSCKTGFVWREAFEGDFVCVDPEIRSLVKQENAEAQNNRR